MSSPKETAAWGGTDVFITSPGGPEALNSTVHKAQTLSELGSGSSPCKPWYDY